MRHRLWAGLVAAMVASGAPALAAPALDGPLKIVIPYGAGGGMDGIMRPLADPLSKQLGVPVVIENKPGGSTKIGTLMTMQAKPDGRTLILMPAPAWIGFHYEGIFDIKPWETMTPVAQVAESPYSVYVAKAGGEFRTWADVIAKVRKSNKPLMASAAASGGFTEMALHEVARQSGVQAIQIPYPSASPARLALLSGEVDVQVDSLAALSGLRNKQTVGLAISTPKRMPQAPEIPTFEELGLKVEMPTNAFSFWGPAGMNPQVVQQLAAAVREAMKDRGFIDTIESGNLIQIRYKSGDEIAGEMRKVEQDWGSRLTAAMKTRAATAKP